MAVFVYTGRTRGGQTITGEMEAANREAVVARLRSQQVIATVVRGKPRAISIPGFGGGVTEKDIVIFTRQFATMIDAGLPLVQCLEILSSQQENKVFKKALIEIRGAVESGATFAAALKAHPKVFTSLYANMVEAGETGGILDTILNRLAQYMEKSMGLKKKVKSAMLYPAVVTVVAIVITILLLVKVVPVFAEIFASFERRLDVGRQCKRDAACYAGKVELRKEGDPTHWAQVERALYSLGHLNAAAQADKIFVAIAYDNEFALDAMVFAAWKLINGKDLVVKLNDARKNSKLDEKLQKPLEELSYVILDKKRDLGLIDTKGIEDTKDKN